MENLKDMVNVMDTTTNKVTRIPKNELSCEMIPVQIEGKDGIYWVETNALKVSNKIIHLPFEGVMKQKIQFIQKTFYPFRGMSYVEWETPFRCESHPEIEVAVWWLGAQKFNELTKDKYKSQKEQVDVYKIFVTSLTCGGCTDVVCPPLSVINKAQMVEIVKEFREYIYKKERA